MLILILFVGFLIGALTILAVEALGFVFFIGRLGRRTKREEEEPKSAQPLDPSSHTKKQGIVWVLNPKKVPKSRSADKLPREHKRKKEILEVAPVRIFAKIKDKSLILAHPDGALREIQLKGCSVAAVSATTLSTRKWARRYPIKVENETSILYEGSKAIYIYLETSWDKESWCKALRIASCTDKEKLKWSSQLNQEFQSYLATLNVGYPLFMKPFVSLDSEHIDRSAKVDGSSKVRHYFKKLSRKMSKGAADNKASAPTVGREERKIGEKWHSLQDSVMGSGVAKTAPVGKPPISSAEGKIAPASSIPSSLGNRDHNTFLCDLDHDDKISGDDGTLCWNLLISRLFFDAKQNMAIKKSFQSRIQRTLSSMRIPNYIGEITCTGIELGSLPPYLSSMRVLPSDMKEVWAFEVDIQYSGGVVLNIETRLEVGESDLKDDKVDTDTESSSIEEVPTDILEGFEYLGKQLELSEGTSDASEHKDESDSELDGTKTSEINRKASPSASKWKSVLNSVAKQVSQVPISLGIKVASLTGTLLVRIKPPPSDQLWFGFTVMPDVDFELESHVGDRKINNGRIALFLINRFKTSIRETLVLPNCENVCIPWMLAEKDDWVTCKDAPFMWRAHNQESSEAPIVSTSTTSTTIFAANRDDALKGTKHDKGSKVEELKTPLIVSSSTENERESKSYDDSGNGEKERALDLESIPSRSSSSRSTGSVPEVGDDGRPKRMGTRARMLGLGKKMGEKLEEKRRVIEERGRHMVERIL